MQIRWDKANVIWTGAIIGVTTTFLWAITRPQLNEITRLKDDLALEREAWQQDTRELQKLGLLERELDTLWARTADFDQQVPQDTDLSGFLQELARRLDARGLHPQRIEPGSAIHSERVVALPITFSVQGPFPALYAMMHDIETMTRLTRVERFEVNTDAEQPQTVTAEIELKVFFQTS